MFMKRRLNIISVVLVLSASLFALEDTATQRLTLQVSDICLVNVTGSPSTLSVSASELGGEDPALSIDDTTFVQYTSIATQGKSRLLTARWEDSSSAPSGCSLKLRATPDLGPQQGHSSGDIILSSSPQSILSEIGSCVTGTGVSQGARLRYSLVIDDISLLQAGESKSVTIILTLTDSN